MARKSINIIIYKFVCNIPAPNERTAHVSSFTVSKLQPPVSTTSEWDVSKHCSSFSLQQPLRDHLFQETPSLLFQGATVLLGYSHPLK